DTHGILLPRQGQIRRPSPAPRMCSALASSFVFPNEGGQTHLINRHLCPTILSGKGGETHIDRNGAQLQGIPAQVLAPASSLPQKQHLAAEKRMVWTGGFAGAPTHRACYSVLNVHYLPPAAVDTTARSSVSINLFIWKIAVKFLIKSM